MAYFDRYLTWVLNHRLSVILLCIAVAAVSAAGLRHLSYVGDYEVFFDEENEHLAAYREMENTYSRNDSVSFVLAPKDGNVFTAAILSVIERLTEEAWQAPFARRVDSISNFQFTTAEGDELVVRDLVEHADELSAEELSQIEAYALSEPEIAGRLVSPSGHVSMVNIRVLFPEIEPDETNQVVTFGRDLMERYKAENPDLTIHLTGSAVINQGFVEGAANDMTSLVPTMYVILLIVAGILLRSFWSVFAIFLLIVLTILSSVGIASWIGLPLTAPSVSAPTIILTIVVATAVHILSRMLRSLREGRSRTEALMDAFRANISPVSLACLTTAIGFLCLLVSVVPPYRFLGLTTAIGAAFTFAYSVTFLPALLSLLPLRPSRISRQHGAVWDGFSHFLISHQNRVLGATLICVVSALSFLPRNQINDTFVTYFDKDLPVRTSAEFAIENMGGLYAVSLSFPAGRDGGISDPSYMRGLEKFSEWARAHPLVAHVATLNHTIKRLNRNMHGDDPDWYVLPQDRELAAQYLLLYEMSLPQGLDLTDQIDIGKSATKVVLSLKDVTNADIRRFEREFSAWQANNLPASMRTVVTGPSVMFAYIWESSALSNLVGMIVAAVMIGLIIMAALRSVRLGLISLIPNLLPAAMAFGIWGATNGWIDVASSSVAMISLGMVVDDTIHFLSKYRYAREQRAASAEAAVQYAFRNVGPALVTTTCVLAIGFMVLAQSTLTLNGTMGLLTAITIVLALVLDFLLLPILLIKLDRAKAPAAVRQLAPA